MRNVRIVAGLALAMAVTATARPGVRAANDPVLNRATSQATRPAVHVENVRLDAPPDTVPGPAVMLKFELVNDGPQAATSPLLRVSITEKPSGEDDEVPRVLVRPFLVRGTPTIEPGYSVTYQMLMRNVSPDCGCVANIVVVAEPQPGEATTP